MSAYKRAMRPMADGGPAFDPGSAVYGAQGMAGGGVPYYETSAIRGIVRQGMLKSPVPGRTDKLPIRVPTGAYVVPADVVSSLGQGNTLAGGTVLDGTFSTTPGMSKFKPPRGQRSFSTRMKFAGGGDVFDDSEGPDARANTAMAVGNQRGLAAGPVIDPYAMAHASEGMMPPPGAPGGRFGMDPNAKEAMQPGGFPGPIGGMSEFNPMDIMRNSNSNPDRPPDESTISGEQQDDGGETTPIIAAGGEYIIGKDALVEKFGDLDTAHRIMDAFVKHARDEHIKTLRKLPGPSK